MTEHPNCTHVSDEDDAPCPWRRCAARRAVRNAHRMRTLTDPPFDFAGAFRTALRTALGCHVPGAVMRQRDNPDASHARAAHRHGDTTHSARRVPLAVSASA